MHNVLNVEINGADGKTPAREFRVQPLQRYQVTDWEAYNGGKVRTLAENLTLKQANEIAIELGRANPGSLVNTMEPPHEGGILYLDEHGVGLTPLLLQALPYAVGAALKQAAIVAKSDELLKLFSEASVAVDVRAPPADTDRAVSMSLADAMAVRRNLLCFHMSTAEIDAALVRAWNLGAAPSHAEGEKGVVTAP